jgi:gamma-glutamyl-gamma-aminobutyrate hydrolase PuuD
VSPPIYGESAPTREDVNLSRDHFEVSLLKAWISAKKGMLFGVCRGHQLIAAALGFKLKAHIENHGDGTWLTHPIHLIQTTQNRFQKLFGNKSITVNSYHHQAVADYNNPEIEVAARADDGTIEALESKDGLIFTTQFHPEFMKNSISKKFFEMMNSSLFDYHFYQCRRLF